MAGILNLTPTPIFRSVSARRKTNYRVFFVKSSANASETPLTSISAPPNFKAPNPKPFSVRPDKIFDILGASLALLFRLTTSVLVSGYSVTVVPANEIPSDQYALGFAGNYQILVFSGQRSLGLKLKETSKLGPRPEKPIEIYEFESCPFCRKVREIVSVLDLEVLYYPCPRNGPNFRPKVSQMGGKQQFPYMVDPNTGVSMYESDDIIKYLVDKYGDGNVPLLLSLGLLTGSSYSPSKLPPKPLEVWAYEASPFCKVVREVLVELELPHILHSCARGSPKRQILYQRVGHFQVPYLEDPNTGVQMFESAEIVDYLRATYAL
ncbi:hypothetical protein Sango_1489400 [Sesamum angolense]|uniref:GST N-terminal domain-containing protein n=1 Tax=Sesamum angolense TaxID=2727404 RepID=A0AAE2BT15_9LAMI|nr:hypothetical protein Sango_1489400 [Sesamum angolense]